MTELKRNQRAYVYALLCAAEKGANEAIINHLNNLEEIIEKNLIFLEKGI